MSVNTEADDKLQMAKHHAQQLTDFLADLVVGLAPGIDRYSEEFRVKLRQAFMDAMSIRDRLL